jgi:glycosyltransferase involved in cell wall biosynthesis
VIAAEQNGGAAVARNLGATQARGDWIAFQDSDDEWLPRKLEKQMARLRAPTPATGPACVGAYCGLLTLGWLDEKPGERLRVRYRPDARIAAVDGDILGQLLRGNLISTQTLVVRRDVFAALGGFDPDTTPIEDWDFVIRLAQQGPIAFVDEPLVQQRFSPNSITRNAGRRLRSLERLVDKHATLFAGYPKLLAHQYYALAGGHRKAGDLAAARGYLARARAADPGNARVWTMLAYVAALNFRPRRPPRS